MKNVRFSIGKIDLGEYNLIDGDVKHTANINGIVFYTGVEINTGESVLKAVA